MTNETRPVPATDWKPVRWLPQYRPFASHRLEQLDARHLVFAEAWPPKLYKAILLGPALLLFLAALVVLVGGSAQEHERAWLFMLPFGGVVIATLFAMQVTRRPTFDRERNAYWCDRAMGRVEDPTPLTRIRAVQLVEADLAQMELNLVLDDGSRRNVIAHGDHPALQNQAAQLGEWLAVPVLSQAPDPASN